MRKYKRKVGDNVRKDIPGKGRKILC